MAGRLWALVEEKQSLYGYMPRNNSLFINKSCNLTYIIQLPSIRINYIISIISVMHSLIFFFIGVDPATTQKMEKLPLISTVQNQNCLHYNALKEHLSN